MNKYEKRMEAMIEYCADLEHQRWAKWQKYMNSRMVELVKGDKNKGMVMSGEDYSRWERQINTAYKDLSEKEKESDRKQVYPYLSYIIKEFNKYI